ncbi:hypothetical protein DFJ73DRAFT_834032 [Zopfochytrium polystomum]|nr:hypothetical protein DFJ73DRAFT_834032 [Zopfochytrium polystomum]
MDHHANHLLFAQLSSPTIGYPSPPSSISTTPPPDAAHIESRGNSPSASTSCCSPTILGSGSPLNAKLRAPSPALKDSFENLEVQINDKAVRKILDLEIANEALLAVNASLEATICEQAAVMCQLRKELAAVKAKTSAVFNATYPSKAPTSSPAGTGVVVAAAPGEGAALQGIPEPTSNLHEDVEFKFQKVCAVVSMLIQEGSKAIEHNSKAINESLHLSQEEEQSPLFFPEEFYANGSPWSPFTSFNENNDSSLDSHIPQRKTTATYSSVASSGAELFRRPNALATSNARLFPVSRSPSPMLPQAAGFSADRSSRKTVKRGGLHVTFATKAEKLSNESFTSAQSVLSDTSSTSTIKPNTTRKVSAAAGSGTIVPSHRFAAQGNSNAHTSRATPPKEGSQSAGADWTASRTSSPVSRSGPSPQPTVPESSVHPSGGLYLKPISVSLPECASAPAAERKSANGDQSFSKMALNASKAASARPRYKQRW